MRRNRDELIIDVAYGTCEGSIENSRAAAKTADTRTAIEEADAVAAFNLGLLVRLTEVDVCIWTNCASPAHEATSVTWRAGGSAMGVKWRGGGPCREPGAPLAV